MTRARVGLLAPCIGIGGADALMLGLVKYAHNLNFVGAAISGTITPEQLAWSKRMIGDVLPYHQHKNEHELDGVTYYDDFKKAAKKIVDQSDIIFSWCFENLPYYVNGKSIPVIDYAQNCDKYAKRIIDGNIESVYYHAACSLTASEVLPKKAENVQVIYNGIDPGRVAPRLGRDRQRKVWDLSNKKILLFMGRFVEEKHPSAVIQALTKLPDDWVGVFVGRGPQENYLHAQGQNYAPGRVFFVEPQFHVGDILAAADVFILPSDFEGHSLALCEAWLAGVPTVYTDFKVMLELESIFGPLGVKIPRLPTCEQLSEAVIKASSETDQMFGLVNNARMVTWNNFTLPTIAAIWEDYIERCIFDWRRRKRKVEIHPILPLEILESA